jgi:REP element-mobilizing transposase RayT
MDDQVVHHLYLHAVFSTKNQEPVLDDEVREELAHVIGGALQDMKCAAVQLYIGADHIHLLYRHSDEVSLDAGIKAVKRDSSAWLRKRNGALKNFEWQESYAAFSVGGMDVGEVAEYLRDQAEYHLIHSFEEEFIKILTEAEVEFDENEIWD